MSRRSRVSFLTIVGLAVLERFVARSGATTDFSTFSDANCQKSDEKFYGLDGFPDGICTRVDEKVSSNFSSFQVVHLDDGCSGELFRPHATTLAIFDIY